MAQSRFFLVNAFANDAHSGNPAAVVLLPPGSTLGDDDAYGAALGRDFGMPMTAIVTPVDTETAEPVYTSRWFTPSGHVRVSPISPFPLPLALSFPSCISVVSSSPPPSAFPPCHLSHGLLPQPPAPSPPLTTGNACVRTRPPRDLVRPLHAPPSRRDDSTLSNALKRDNGRALGWLIHSRGEGPWLSCDRLNSPWRARRTVPRVQPNRSQRSSRDRPADGGY